MFGWLKRRQSVALHPESRWTVSHSGAVIRVIDDKGRVRELAASDLSGVAIETNDSGPWGSDLWWLLFDADDQIGCAYPQGASGEDALLDYLTTLPDFDHKAMIEAMASTENAVFSVWRKRA